MKLGGDFYTEQELKDIPFRHLGENVKIHNRASIYGVENISIGNNVRIDDFSILIATHPMEIGSYRQFLFPRRFLRHCSGRLCGIIPRS